MTAPVTVSFEGDLAIATVSAPPLNLMDDAMIAGVVAALDEFERRGPRAVLWRAEGRVWTGGVDVEVFAGRDAQTGAELWRAVLEIAHRNEALRCPTIFSAHALCLTWGFELAMACDLLIAGEGASFGLVEAVVGLTPSMGGTQRLAARAGSARAKEFVMTGNLYDARTLHDWGAVNWVVPDDELAARTLELAQRLAAGPTVAHAATKQILAALDSGGVRAADELVPEVSGALFESEDLRGGVASFLADGPGKAKFSGK